MDVGGAGPFREPGRLHKRIAAVAERCVGVDNWEQGVQELSAQGYDMVLGDAESFELNERFDVVVLCEVMEHVSNPGLVISNIRKHLVEGGRMIITTPNPHSLKKIGWNLLKDEATTKARERKEEPLAHVCYFFPDDFRRLAERYGFEQLEVRYLMSSWREMPTVKGRLVFLSLVWLPERIKGNNWLGIYSG